MIKAKTIFKFILILLIAGLLCSAVWIFVRFRQLYHPITYRCAEYTEQAAVLSNPYCGYYQMYGYTLSDEGLDPVRTWSSNILSHNSSSLILLEVNLRNYSGSDISSGGLSQLDELLDTFCGEGRSLIVRFLYDWDGKAKSTEPASRTQIESHMRQIAPAINEHAASILTLQGVFTGNCGEMNNTRYGSFEDIAALMQVLDSVIDKNIYLAVRTPSHLRGVTGSKDAVSFEQAWDGSLSSRLGLYNDGMLGSVYDLGTYDDTPHQADSPPSDKGTREEELAFQETLCQFVPNGGEVVLDNPYNDLSAALNDLSRMHVSYLNGGHDAAVLDKWKASVYEGGGVFNGWNGYDYVNAHLGYRYLITASSMEFDPLKEENASLSITLTNTGFAPAYRRFDTTLTITGAKSQTSLTLPLDWDNRTLSNGAVQTLCVSVPARKLSPDDYTVTISMRDPADGRTIFFANQTSESDFSVLLGNFTME